MVFSAPVFLFGFLPLSLAIYHLAPRSWRNLVLIALSGFFYIWGAGAFVLILLISALVDWVILGRIIVSRGKSAGRNADRWVALSLVIDLGLLGLCKYAGFLASASNNLLGRIGSLPVVDIVVPLALSFFTFQRISIAVDARRGEIERRPPFSDYLLVTSFFPHLIAGPIVRWRDMAGELHDRRAGFDDLAAGSVRFVHGLSKKLLIADQVGVLADKAFAVGTTPANPAEAWVGALAFCIQIYFDFSGYSDMAIGLGRMFGFRFPENFNRPYSALSVTDFWRRWHITLSTWFRDYLYLPLGGSRGKTWATVRNLLIVFLLTGLWHGASFHYVAWGLYHGAWLLLERALGQRALESRGLIAVVRRAFTFVVVTVGWVLFRAPDISQAVSYLGVMFKPVTQGIGTTLRLIPNDLSLLVLTLAVIGVVLLPRTYVAGRSLMYSRGHLVNLHRAFAMIALLPISLLLASASSFQPFIYFQF